MKVAIFTDIYAPWGSGGVASSIAAQKQALEKLGHEVVVFCPGKNAREKGVVTVPIHRYIKINNTPLALRPSKVELAVLQKYPDFADFDVVHVHYEASCSIAGIRLARRFGVPLVQTMHGREDMAIAINVPHPFKNLVAVILNFLHRKCLPHTVKIRRDKFQAPTLARAKMWELVVNHANYADMVLTPSRHFARKLEHYGVIKPLIPLSNGISADLVNAEVEARELQDGDVLKMIWNSRVSCEKRILPFLQALTKLKRPYILYVYGDGNALKRAKRFVKKHSLKVKFFGRQSREKILERMQAVHLGVMASYNFDTQGMTLLEAQSTGLPVFFCDPEMVEVVPTGSFVLAGGPDATAMALTLDSVEAKKVKAMSKQMLKRREEVCQDNSIMELVKVYQRALELRAS